MAKQAASPRPSKMPPAPTSSDVSDGGMKIFYPPEKSERSPKGSNQQFFADLVLLPTNL